MLRAGDSMLTHTGHVADETYPPLSDTDAFRDYFEREGYIVVRGALPPAVCGEAVDAFLKEVHLDHRALFLRQAPADYAAHVYTQAGHMQQPIVGLQDLCGRRYPQFRAAALALLTDAVLRRAIETLLGAPARLVDSLYFDASQFPWAQRDGRFIDATRPDAMIGAWIAAEDIEAGAGRFYVLPRSHLRPPTDQQGRDPDCSCSTQATADFAALVPLRQVAPMLKQGDLLLWSAMTIHGSLPTPGAAGSRRAFSARYIAGSGALARRGGVVASVAGMEVLHRSDPRSLAGRAANLVRARYPGAWPLLRRLMQLRPWGGLLRERAP
jgi:phytanoyl-CoA hydroxylase